MVAALACESLLGILTVGAYMLPVPVLLALAMRLVSPDGVGAPPKPAHDDRAAGDGGEAGPERPPAASLG